MLTACRLSDQVKVEARDSERTHAPFCCPSCAQEVTLNKGRIRIHHFKHKPPVTCSRGRGETPQHLCAKQEIYDALLGESGVSDLELEKDFGYSVADVYAKIRGVPVAIEIQRSTLSVRDIMTRTTNYHQLGIAVLWVGLLAEGLSGEMYSPRAWERWCHAAYFGRVYYWEHGQSIRAVHFDLYRTYVEQRTWFETGGYEQSSGGYWKTSKRFITPKRGAPIQLSENFRSTVKRAWSGGTVHIPECRLYVDTLEKWW